MKNLALLTVLVPLIGATPAAAQHDMHGMSGMNMSERSAQPLPKESGQSAFGAITEAVEDLDADRTTDWSKVNIDVLRDHLVDMDNVTLHARVRTMPIAGGARFEVSGEGPVIASIQRMTRSHASMSGEISGQRTLVQETPTGSVMTVTAEAPANAQKIRALGFFGEMTTGVHHQLHHLMMAKGEMHH